MDKQRMGLRGECSAKLSLVLLVLNVVMLAVAAVRLFCPDGVFLPQKEQGVNLEGICAAAEAALGVLSSGDVPRLGEVTGLRAGVGENACLGMMPVDAPVMVITASEGVSWEEVLKLPEGMKVSKVFVVEAAPEQSAGQM